MFGKADGTNTINKPNGMDAYCNSMSFPTYEAYYELVRGNIAIRVRQIWGHFFPSCVFACVCAVCPTSNASTAACYLLCFGLFMYSCVLGSLLCAMYDSLPRYPCVLSQLRKYDGYHQVSWCCAAVGIALFSCTVAVSILEPSESVPEHSDGWILGLFSYSRSWGAFISVFSVVVFSITVAVLTVLAFAVWAFFYAWKLLYVHYCVVRDSENHTRNRMVEIKKL